MCLYPKLIKNKKYEANKKNGGNVPPVIDQRTLLVPIKCGKCIECMKQYSREWTVRLNEDIRTKQEIQFVTLTFSDESIQELTNDIWEENPNLHGYELDNKIAKMGVRRYLERWRKKYKKSVKHWLVTELGHNGTENIHIHGLIYTKEKEGIEKIWKYGYVYIGDYVNERTINYMCKYITKIDKKHKEYKPKILASAGIGKKYAERIDGKENRYKGEETREYYTTRQGIKLPLPIYLRNKIYNEEEREKLWIQKIEKNERYVMGAKIDTSKGLEEYQGALKEARRTNKQLGYGNDTKNWEREDYEEKQRWIMQQKRLK